MPTDLQFTANEYRDIMDLLVAAKKQADHLGDNKKSDNLASAISKMKMIAYNQS